MKTFIELAKTRYSVRKYKPTSIPTELLAQVLEAGRIAPTGCNNQPQRVKVITAAEDLAKVDQCTPCRFGAPAVLLVCYDKTVCWRREFDGKSCGVADACIVATHMMLQAHDLGLGTCWVMYFDPAKVAEQFALPEHIVPVAILPIGYPVDDAAPAPTKRFGVENMLL
ncbi:MAG: nitroreductase family protein [Oscillospiraceae bacterium]|jgi:nitroreductase|nr:nitroreductase family protein [Oscillospiraceae bacterium]